MHELLYRILICIAINSYRLFQSFSSNCVEQEFLWIVSFHPLSVTKVIFLNPSTQLLLVLARVPSKAIHVHVSTLDMKNYPVVNAQSGKWCSRPAAFAEGNNPSAARVYSIHLPDAKESWNELSAIDDEHRWDKIRNFAAVRRELFSDDGGVAA